MNVRVKAKFWEDKMATVLLLFNITEVLSRFIAAVQISLFTLVRLSRTNGAQLGIWVPNKH